MTAVFHTCSHGFSRVGGQHGYFRRLLSWDLRQQQMDDMKSFARESALFILRLIIMQGVDLFERVFEQQLVKIVHFTEVITFLVPRLPHLQLRRPGLHYLCKWQQGWVLQDV
jgi:hypothetical protein